MFEKEAKERARKIEENQTLGVYDSDEDYARDSGYNDGKVTGYEEGFKDGAEFGYNKANEWHYMEDELPPKKVPLNIITFDKNKNRRVWVGEYDGGNGQWWTGYFNHFIDVPYAWKEITFPELK